MPALAASYAGSRGLPLVAIPIDHQRHRGNTSEQRDAHLVELANAAILVGDATEVRDLLDRVKAKGLRVVGVVVTRSEPVEPAEPDDGLAMVRGLPD